MAHHFSNSSHNQKRSYDNFQSALLDCNKWNSRIDNLGGSKKVPYKCKICNKIHIGSHNKKTITLKVRGLALEKINESISTTVLIGKINLE